MSLREYQHKRKFDVTSEPSGKSRVTTGQRFVVQKHAASRLHYDFRLEVDGVLKSWAVPHGPSLDPSVKSLAVQVEDHPIDYADFEGTIPAGEYGGGTVMVWDRGTWETEDGQDLARALKQGKASFRLRGEKLEGNWALVRMRRLGEKNWLLIKKQDDFAVPLKEKDILSAAPRSVLTGRDMSQIADNEKPVRGTRKKGTKKKGAAKQGAAKASGTKETKRTSRAVKQSASTETSKAGAKKKPTTKRATRSSSAHVKRSKAANAAATKIAGHLRDTPRVTKKQLANFRPQLATLSDEVPEGDGWLHEVKLDGYRILARIDGGNAQLLTRRGLDWSDHFPKVAEALSTLPLENTILDGEVVALDENGVSDFQRLQNWMTQHNQAALVYYVFDLPILEGHDLTHLPLLERKEILAQVLQQHLPNNSGTVRYHDHIVGSGMQVLRQACNYAMEGIVSKNINSQYVPRRSESWLKVKCLHNQEFVIAGYTKPAGERTGFGALLLGYYDGQDLVYCGRVGTGFTETSLRELTSRLKKLETDKCPYARSPDRSQQRGVTWLEPKLVAEISYAARTEEGLLRHAVFHGLREDKLASQVVLEKPVSHPKSDHPRTRSANSGSPSDEKKGKQPGSKPSVNRQPASKQTAKELAVTQQALKKATKKASPPARGKVKKRSVQTQPLALSHRESHALAEARISHPERVVYREPELTKLDMARYFLNVAPWMLPGVANRPLTLVRCPQGSFGQCFFQKHVDDRFPEGVEGVEIEEDTKTGVYPVVRDALGLLSLAQMNVLEVHLWPALADDVEQPDRLIFDLDPGEGVEWPWIVEGARDIRKMLERVGLESFVRTSGGKGLHVVAPFARESANWDLLKEFASLVAHTLEAQHPDRYIATMSKSKRRGKVFIDYLRNQRGATAVASYSPRARVGATVATPIAWRELSDSLTNRDFTVQNILQRLKRQKSDPWKGFNELDQPLPSAATQFTKTSSKHATGLTSTGKSKAAGSTRSQRVTTAKKPAGRKATKTTKR